ncbi:MAG: stage II sporulation protein M [Bacteroidota bacterium]
MKEIVFIHKNKKKWERFEQVLQKGYKVAPDELSALFIQLNEDLAYSRTYYPQSSITSYLNALTQKAYSVIYRNKPVTTNKIIKFWKHDYPLLFYSIRKEVLYSFLVFFIAALIGVLSTHYDPEFPRVILGDQYVNMTLDNMEKGDPMAVYKSMEQLPMFLGISMNNIYVSFIAFLFGCFTALGTGFLLLQNGIMLGTFQYFMIQKGFFVESTSTIWIHGTLEIFSIIVAGAAGIVLGNSIVFPKSYSRGVSFRKGAAKGGKVIFGLIPVFIMAGFIEGFITRYTQAPYVLKLSVIIISLAFIVYYYVILPNLLIKQSKNKNNGNTYPI